MRPIVIISVFLTLLSFEGFGQSKDDGQQIIDKFFEVYTTKGHEPALKYAFGTNKWMESNTDAIQNVIFELEKSVSLVGKYIGQEEIKSKKVGSRFRIASYFVYYDRQPLRFTFELYKNNEGWMIWNFQFDSDYDEEIEEAMKLYRLKELSDWN
jgi:hypothetical protein